jgi:hypothetical protein
MSSAANSVDALRERGDHRFDRVRFHFIEALARRAAAYDGEVRRILDEKVATLLAVYCRELESHEPAAPDATANATATATLDVPTPRGLLGQLVDRIAETSASRSDIPPTGHAATALTYLGSIWSKLNIDRRLNESFSAVPKNAGPLNSHHIVHQSLALMRDLSPEYLHRFMAHVDALAWLDDAHAVGQKKPPRGK